MKKTLITILSLTLFYCNGNENPAHDKKANPPAYDLSYIYIPEKIIQKEKLKKYTKIELMLMKSEIYARHGKLYGKPWQKMYIKSKKWFKPENENKLSSIARKNLEMINNEIPLREFLVKNIKKPDGVKFTGLYTKLKITKKKNIEKIFKPITKAHWDYLLNKEYGMIKRNKKLAGILKHYKGSSGYYKLYVDDKGIKRLIIDYTGCCGIILAKEPRNVYIFSKTEQLLKRAKFFHDKKEEEWYYFYNNGKLIKGIFIIYNIKTGLIIETGIMTGSNIE